MKGNGSIIQDGQRYRAFFCHNGKRISKRFNSKQEAMDWLAINRSDVALGEFVEPTGITFGQWMLECLRYKSQRVKASTMAGYKVRAKCLTPLANVKLQSLNGIQIQRVIDAIPAPGMRTGAYRFVSMCINRAYKLQLIRKNILLQTDPPKYSPKEKDVFSKDELSRIYKALENHKYKAFFTLAFATGCRIGELLGLKIQSVHDGYIRIENNIVLCKDGTPKCEASNRAIALPPNIITMLRREWEANGSVLNSYVFSNRPGKPIKNATIYSAWRDLLAKAHVPYRNIHYIRHTHATQLLSSGVPIIEVQHRLGHSTASTTLNKYGHILLDNKDKVLNAVDNLLENMVI